PRGRWYGSPARRSMMLDMRTELIFRSGPGALRRVAGLGAGLLAGALLAASPLHAARPDPLPVPPALALLQTQTGKVLTGDHTVEEGETVEDIVIVGGDLRVRGEITGDAVVVGGDLILESTGSVLGDAIVTGGEILDQGGRVRGEMRMLGTADGALAEQIGRAVGEDVRVE